MNRLLTCYNINCYEQEQINHYELQRTAFVIIIRSRLSVQKRGVSLLTAISKYIVGSPMTIGGHEGHDLPSFEAILNIFCS